MLPIFVVVLSWGLSNPPVSAQLTLKMLHSVLSLNFGTGWHWLGIQRHYWHHCNDDLFVGVHFAAQHHFFRPLVTFVHLRINETQTITAVSKHNYCSHKLHCYLGGQHRLATSFLMLRFHHWRPPRVCLFSSNFQANRLRRLPAAPLNPLTGFQFLHAFAMHLH